MCAKAALWGNGQTASAAETTLRSNSASGREQRRRDASTRNISATRTTANMYASRVQAQNGSTENAAAMTAMRIRGAQGKEHHASMEKCCLAVRRQMMNPHSTKTASFCFAIRIFNTQNRHQ